MPFFIAIFYVINAEKWEMKQWKSKWGSVLDGMDTEPDPRIKRFNKRWALFFPMFLLIRRVAFVVAVFSMSELLVFQLLVLIGSALLNAAYLWKWQNISAILKASSRILSLCVIELIDSEITWYFSVSIKILKSIIDWLATFDDTYILIHRLGLEVDQNEVSERL